MTLQAGISCRQRYNLLAAQNAINGSVRPDFGMRSGKRLARAPLITYSRKDRPLSLTADQFVRRDTYDLPSDDCDEDLDNHRPPYPSEAGSRSSSMSALSDADTVGHALATAAQLVNSTKSSESRHRDFAAIGLIRTQSGNATNKKKAMSSQGRPKSPRLGTKGSDAAGSKRAALASDTSRRRLPGNELIFVPLLPEDAVTHSSRDIRRSGSQDSHREATKPASVTDAFRESTTSATAIRKRLVTAKLRTKKLRRKRSHKDMLLGFDRPAVRIGDGFEMAERQITIRPKSMRQLRRPQSTAVYWALALNNGPLPEVVFNCPTDEPKAEFTGGHSTGTTAISKEEKFSDLLVTSASRSKRRVSFSNQLELIKAQLSSVRAIRRPTDGESDPESEDGGDEDEDADAVVEGFEAVGPGDDEECPNGEAMNILFPEPEVQDGSSQQLRARPATKVTVDDIEEDNDMVDSGVTLTFPPPTRQYARRPSAGLMLNESNENFEDVPPNAKKPLRRRSILKNSTCVPPETTYSPEHTEANTRRNSVVVLEDSRYFSGAMESLAAPNPAKHRIVPRRPDRYEKAQGQDSEDADIEMSWQPLSYVQGDPAMSVLRASTENVYTSRSLPGPPRDLKALTRSVSREHGTLSQSTRRRSRLSFQSPMMIR